MTPTTVLLVLLLIGTTVTSLTALAPWYVVEPKWSKFSKVILGLLLTAALLTELRRVHALVWIVVISLGYYGVRGGLIALATGGSYKLWGPPGTMIEDNNELAAALLVTLPLMNYLRLQSEHAVVRLGLLGAMALTLVAILASYSRGALIALAALTVVLWWNSRQKLLLGGFLAAALAGAILLMPQAWVDRMNTIQSYEEDQSASARLTIWSTAWQLALDRPLLGSGFMGPYTREVVDRVDPTSPVMAVHSIWLETLGEHGFPTFVIWLAILACALANCRWLARAGGTRSELQWAHDLGKMVQASIVAYLVAGSFLSLSYWDVYFTILLIVAAARVLVAASLRDAAEVARANTHRAALSGVNGGHIGATVHARSRVPLHPAGWQRGR